MWDNRGLTQFFLRSTRSLVTDTYDENNFDVLLVILRNNWVCTKLLTINQRLRILGPGVNKIFYIGVLVMEARLSAPEYLFTSNSASGHHKKQEAMCN